MHRYRKGLLLVPTTAVAILLWTSSVWAFLGNIRIGGTAIPCVVACGGDRGIINTKLPGDVLTFFGAPTPDGFKGAGTDVVDYADRKFNATLAQKLSELDKSLTEQRSSLVTAIGSEREQLLQSLTALADTSVSQLDDTLQQAIERGDEVLDRRSGALNTILTKHTNLLIQVARLILIGGLGAGVFMFLLALAYRSRFKKGTDGSPLGPMVGYPVLGFVVFALVVLFIPLGSDKEDLVAHFKSSYAQHLVQMRFTEALFDATQLQVLDRDSKLFEAYVERSAILRDLFQRPTLLQDGGGTRDLLRRADYAQNLLVKEHGYRDPDLDVVAAFAVWQTFPTRDYEYWSATVCASALESASKLSLERHEVVLLPLAKHYLASYLANPISDEQMESGGLLEDIRKLGVKYRPLKELLEVNAANPPAEVKSEPGTDGIGVPLPMEPFAAVVAYGAAVRRLYRQMIPLYVEMSFLQGLASQAKTSAEQKAAAISKRKSVAGRIVEAWTAFSTQLSNPLFADTSVRIGALKLATAFHARAKAYQEFAGEGSVPVVSVITVKEDKTTVVHALHYDWMKNLIVPVLRPSTARALELAANESFLKQQEALRQFDDAIIALLKASQDYDESAGEVQSGALSVAGRSAADLGVKMGLFGCSAEKFSPSGGSFECKVGSETSQTYQITEIVLAQMKSEAPALSAWSSRVKQGIAIRSIPII